MNTYLETKTRLLIYKYKKGQESSNPHNTFRVRQEEKTCRTRENLIEI